jgi:hypothetical protein
VIRDVALLPIPIKYHYFSFDTSTFCIDTMVYSYRYKNTGIESFTNRHISSIIKSTRRMVEWYRTVQKLFSRKMVCTRSG